MIFLLLPETPDSDISDGICARAREAGEGDKTTRDDPFRTFTTFCCPFSGKVWTLKGGANQIIHGPLEIHSSKRRDFATSRLEVFRSLKGAYEDDFVLLHTPTEPSFMSLTVAVSAILRPLKRPRGDSDHLSRLRGKNWETCREVFSILTHRRLLRGVSDIAMLVLEFIPLKYLIGYVPAFHSFLAKYPSKEDDEFLVWVVKKEDLFA